MGRDRHYVHGDFYRIDDRTGFPERAKKTRKEWTGLIVHNDRWEYRHPQDFVKGYIDDQTVPDPRPLPSSETFLGPVSTTVGPPPIGGALLLERGGHLTLEGGRGFLGFEAGNPGSTVIPVLSVAGMSVTDVVEIMLNNNEFFRTTIAAIDTVHSAITIAAPLPYFISAGNVVNDLTATTIVAPSRAELSTDLGG